MNNFNAFMIECIHMIISAKYSDHSEKKTVETRIKKHFQ